MASLLWTSIAILLYIEIAVTLILCLPVPRPSFWKKLFDSRICVALQPIFKTSFYVLLIILGGLFAESVRGMNRYGTASPDDPLDTRLSKYTTMFRAQRNFYITGFALFLMIVLQRLVAMQYKQATLEEKAEEVGREKKTVKDKAPAKPDKTE